MKYIAIDFETAYRGEGCACSLGIVESDGKAIIDEWYRLMRPKKMEFNDDCIRVNGIHPEDVRNEPEFPAFGKDIIRRLEGGILFAHNASFDMGVLANMIDTYDLEDIHFRYGDTVELSRKLWKELPNHKLNTVARFLGFDFQHHQALDDARACEYIVRKAIRETGATSVESMMESLGQPLLNFVIKRTMKTSSLF